MTAIHLITSTVDHTKATAVRNTLNISICCRSPGARSNGIMSLAGSYQVLVPFTNGKRLCKLTVGFLIGDALRRRLRSKK
jgi:hypothetical protein